MKLHPLQSILIIIFFCSCTRTINEYYQSGELKSKCEVKWPGNEYHGVCTYFDKEGKITSKESYRKGLLNGIWVDYFDNGTLRFKIEYKNDFLWNVLAYKDINGSDLDYGDFNEGNGVLKLYNTQGELRASGFVKDGLRDGYWKLYTNIGLTDSTLYIRGASWGIGDPSNVFFH